MNRKKTIIVVDDDLNQLQLVADFLKENDYTVHSAATGTEALRKILDFRPDMVILDLFLPDMKGSDICLQMRASTATRHIPIILCTAHKIDSIEKIKGFRSGADDYLIRPFDLSELLARMEAIFRRAQVGSDTLLGITAVIKKPETPPAPSAPVRRPPPAAPQRQEQVKIIRRVWDVMNHPSQAFTQLDEHKDFVIGLGLVLGSPATASFSKLLLRSGSFDNWIGFFSLGLVVNVLMWFGTAGLLHMALPFQGVSMSMRRALAIAGLSWAPRFVESILGFVYSLISMAVLGGEPVNFSTGVNMLPGLPSNGFVSFVSHIGLFNVWSMWLTLAAFWTAGQSSGRRWNSIAVAMGFACLLFGAFSAS